MIISIVIPTYNEKENIIALLDKICKVCKDIQFEIIVVDDNSPDKTWELVKKYKDKRVKLLKREGKLGLASAVIDGFNAAKGDIFVVADADFSHDYDIIPEMIKAVEQGNEFAVGSRFIKGGGIKGWPIKRIIVSKVATLMAKILLKVKVKDPMSGFFAIRKDVFEKVKDKLNPKGYKILLELLARTKSNKVKEIPYVFKDRIKGKSKLSSKIISEYIKMISELMR